MKSILCYGDSNTWGADPNTNPSARFDLHTRWPGVLRDTLGTGWWVIEEGLSARTSVHDDPIERNRNGLLQLEPCLTTHKPIDIVVMMLGTNDLKHRFNLIPYDIAWGVRLLCDLILASSVGSNAKPPELILIAPPITVAPADMRYAAVFQGAEEKSKHLADLYAAHAEELKCHFLNAGDVVISSSIDGVHFDASEHRKLGQHVAAYIQKHFAQ
jgi:lysophospholipase L1-like esterase